MLYGMQWIPKNIGADLNKFLPNNILCSISPIIMYYILLNLINYSNIVFAPTPFKLTISLNC